MPTAMDERFADAVQELGLAEPSRVRECLDALRGLEQAGQHAPLPSLFLLKGWLTDDQVRHVEARLASSADRTVLAIEDPSRAGVTTPSAPPVSSLFPGTGSLFGRYVLTQELGRGGMGIVFKARDPHLERHVALKLLLSGRAARGDEVVRFQREAKAAARLRHANILQVHDIGTQDGTPYLTMDLVEGTSLDRRLRARDLPLRDGVDILARISEAVDHAHREGIVHRDLKPGNVLLDAAGTPYLTDFGLAKDLFSDSGQVTGSTAALGTPAYMSPEQATGKSSQVDARTDVFSLGVILYELLVGRPPFVGANSIEIMMNLVQKEAVPPRSLVPGVPPELEAVCLKAMEKEPDRRYASAGAFADDLRRWLRGEAVSVAPLSRLARTLRRARGRRVEVLLLGLIACLGVLLVVQVRASFRRKEEARLKKEEEERDLVERKRREAARGKAQAEYTEGLSHLGRTRERLEALRCLTEAVNADPEYVEARLERGRANLFLFRWTQAVADFDEALRLAPSLFTASYLRGYVRFLGGDFARAAADFDRVVALDPQSDLGRLSVVAARALRGEVEAARQAAQELVGRIESNEEELHLLLAWLRSSVDRDLAGARAALDRAAALTSEDPRVQLTRALVELAWGRAEESLAQVDKALAAVPNGPYLLRVRSLALRDLGRFAEALADVDACLAANEEDPDLLVVRAKVMVLAGDVDGAAPLLARAEALAPRWGEVDYARGLLERSLGRGDAALAAFASAREKEPTLAAALVRGAELHRERGALEPARAALDLALAGRSLPPFEAFVACLERARVRGLLGDAAGAAEDCRAALAILPGRADALEELGGALDTLGRPEEAIDCWEKARSADARRDPVLARRIQAARGRVLLGKEELAGAEEYVGRAEVWMGRAADAAPIERLRLWARAESDLRRAVEKEPRHRKAHFRLACLHAQWTAALRPESEEAAAEHVRLALGALRRALECGYSPTEARSLPELEPIRSDPAYLDVLRAAPDGR